MRTYILLLSAVFFLQNGTLAQTDVDQRPLNAAYLSFLGDATFIGVNYERSFQLQDDQFLAVRAGVGYIQEFQLCLWGPCEGPDEYATFPHHVTLNIGKKRHFFELGAGGTFLSGDVQTSYYAYPVIGARLHSKPPKNLLFRVHASYPLFNGEIEDIVFIPLGLSFGVVW